MTAAARYIVIARSWTPELERQFGAMGSEHTLTDAEVVAAIRAHGRASIAEDDATSLAYRGVGFAEKSGLTTEQVSRSGLRLGFENDYD